MSFNALRTLLILAPCLLLNLPTGPAAAALPGVEDLTAPQVAAGHNEAAGTSALDPDQPVSLSRDGAEPAVRSFVIEGEDRVSISFERPRLSLDLDPRSAPGLDWRQTWEKADPLPAVLARTALEPGRFTARPWLNELAMDEVVVFNPEAPELAAWKMTIVDSRGATVRVMAGKGTPPASLAWNGRRDDGTAAWPGLIYSFVLETEDPAGNRRTFSGRGFHLPAYRLRGKENDLLVLGGADLDSVALLEESASWLNQAPGLERPIIIRATARDRAQANRLAGRTRSLLAGKLCGDPARLLTEVQVVPDAPDGGVIEVVAAAAGS